MNIMNKEINNNQNTIFKQMIIRTSKRKVHKIHNQNITYIQSIKMRRIRIRINNRIFIMVDQDFLKLINPEI